MRGRNAVVAMLLCVGSLVALSTAGCVRGHVREQPEQPSGDSSTGEELSMTISVGVAERDDRKTTPEQVIKGAYKALYRAKLDGGNLVKR